MSIYLRLNSQDSWGKKLCEVIKPHKYNTGRHYSEIFYSAQ